MQKKYIVAGSGTLLLMLTLLFVTLARSNAYANPFTQNVWLAQNIGETRETLGFDTATNAPRFILPKGLRSADGSAYWSAFRASGATALHSFDVTKGSIRASFALEGDWELGAVSATGKWLALKRIATETERAAYTKNNAWKTTVALVDAATRKTTRTLSLNGNFDVDALNTAGSKLYLIEHLPASKPDHYQVRLFDVALGQLNEGVLVDKRNIDEVMSGYCNGGREQYRRTARGFIHAVCEKIGCANARECCCAGCETCLFQQWRNAVAIRCRGGARPRIQTQHAADFRAGVQCGRDRIVTCECRPFRQCSAAHIIERAVGTTEPQPIVKITERQLDGSGAFVSGGATNAYSSDFWQWLANPVRCCGTNHARVL